MLVLAVVKQGLYYYYACLHDLANQHKTLRQMLQPESYDIYEYTERTLQNNIDLLLVTVLDLISDLVVQEGWQTEKRPWRRSRRPR